ncbi:MAG: hypothetical protein E7316_07565 [Clostridiales bacterium]|nr:hypothetical protein [Clostridiales bacterium]
MQLTRSDILAKLKEIMQSMYDTPSAQIQAATEETRLIEELGFTSVSYLYMVIIVEENFGVRFDQVGGNQFQTVGDVITYIQSQQS